MSQPPGEPPDAPDDRALLAAHLAGDPEAFGSLFARHRDRLWAVALRTTGDPEEAADALQDGLVSAFRRADSFRGDAAVTTWLHRIVVNACLDRMRRRKVRLTDPLPDDLDEPVHRGGPAAAGLRGAGTVDPVDAVLAEERRTAVLHALDALPPEQRAALVLVDMHGYSTAEAARILGCAPGTVKSRCSRGRSRLVPLLGLLRPEPAGLGEGNPRPAPHVQPSEADHAGSPHPQGGPDHDTRPHDTEPHDTGPDTGRSETEPSQTGQEVTNRDP